MSVCWELVRFSIKIKIYALLAERLPLYFYRCAYMYCPVKDLTKIGIHLTPSIWIVSVLSPVEFVLHGKGCVSRAGQLLCVPKAQI